MLKKQIQSQSGAELKTKSANFAPFWPFWLAIQAQPRTQGKKKRNKWRFSLPF